jgi:hypothetical protein
MPANNEQLADEIATLRQELESAPAGLGEVGAAPAPATPPGSPLSISISGC